MQTVAISLFTLFCLSLIWCDVYNYFKRLDGFKDTLHEKLLTLYTWTREYYFRGVICESVAISIYARLHAVAPVFHSRKRLSVRKLNQISAELDSISSRLDLLSE